jgi:hypothetical protein
MVVRARRLLAITGEIVESGTLAIFFFESLTLVVSALCT